MATKNEQSEARTVGFLILSSLCHTALAIGVLTLSLNAKKIVEVTEVQFLDSKPELAPVQTAPEITPETVKEEIATAPIVTAPQEAPISHTPPPPVKIAKALPAAATKPAAQPAQVTQEESPVVLPILETAELDEAQAQEESAGTAELKDDDVAEDFNKVDEEQFAKTAAVQNELQADMEKELSEKNEKLAAIQKQTEAESAQLAAANAEKRAEERAALAASQAAEAQAGGGSGQGEIRALEDLKQISGNRRPMYDAEDRLKNRQGEVAFLAYVSKQGAISQFKLLKSSGHRELDIKTLKAIRDWKFYPGQEGWVEIPFKWDLKGGPQEMPATLRRAKVSTSY